MSVPWIHFLLCETLLPASSNLPTSIHLDFLLYLSYVIWSTLLISHTAVWTPWDQDPLHPSLAGHMDGINTGLLAWIHSLVTSSSLTERQWCAFTLFSSIKSWVRNYFCPHLWPKSTQVCPENLTLRSSGKQRCPLEVCNVAAHARLSRPSQGPGNLQECIAALLLSRLETCFAWGFFPQQVCWGIVSVANWDRRTAARAQVLFIPGRQGSPGFFILNHEPGSPLVFSSSQARKALWF